MAALCVASPGRDCVFPRQRIPRTLRTGLDDGSSRGRMCRETREAGGSYRNANGRYLMHTAINIQHTAAAPTSRQKLSHPHPLYIKASTLVAELLSLLSSPPNYTEIPPPPYSPETDPPPTYNPTTDELASAYVQKDITAPRIDRNSQRHIIAKSDCYGVMADIDFGDTKGIQSRGGKKAKQAAKKAQQARWQDGDEGDGGVAGDDDTKEGDGGENGSAGGGAGGAGGGDDNNGDEPNDDDWLNNGAKKTKKGKKNKKQEEDEKKKQEEEERKKKEEEDAAAGGNSLNWADDANDVNAADDWTGFTAKKDKKKKGKKVPDEPTPAVPDPPTSTFQDISLDDGAPNLDFSFGGTKDTKAKDTSSGFGTWGNTWDFNSPSIGTTDAKKEEKSKKDKEEKDTSDELGDNNPWGFGSKAKATKKKNTGTGFDFGNFGSVDEANEFDVDGDIGGGDTKSTDNAWGFSPVNKKEDKKKKGEKAKEEPLLEPEPKEEDTWSAWGSKATTKKKSKKGAVEDEIPPPPPAPVAPIPGPPADEEWSSFSFGGKKDKKKTKKSILDDKASETKDDPVEADISSTGFDWGASTGSKKDKKGKKGLISEVKDDPIVPSDIAESKVEDDEDWMNGAWSSKPKKEKEKKSKKATTEETITSFDFSPTVDTKTTTSDPPEETWGAFTTTKAKKGKKGAKVEEIPPPPVAPVPEPEPIPEVTDTWSSLGKKEKKTSKKGKVISPEPSIADPDLAKIDELPESDTMAAWGSTSKTLKSKDLGVKRKPLAETVVPEPEPEIQEKVDDTPEWGLSPKEKKKREKEAKEAAKKKAVIEPVVANLDLEEPEIEEPSWNTWGSTTIKDKKKTSTSTATTTSTKKKGIHDVVEEIPKEKVDDELWGDSWNTKKTPTGKKGKKEELPPPVPTPPAQGLTPEPVPVDFPDIDDFGGDTWAPLSKTTTKTSTSGKKGLLSKTSSAKSKKEDAKAKPKDADFDLDDLLTSPAEEQVDKEKEKEDPPAKTTRSIWGSMATTSTSKSKLAREKEEKARKEAEEKARIEAEEAEAAEAAEAARIKEEEEVAAAAAAATAKKSSKTSKTTGKLLKTTSKTSEKTDDKKKNVSSAFDEDPLIDILDEPAPKEEKAKTSKLKKSTTSKIAEKVMEEEKEEETNGDNYFGWGSTSKKTTGSKTSDAKKEITKQGLTNESDALADLDFLNTYDKPSTSKSAKTTMSSSATRNKLTAGSSVAARIKALETSKEETGKKSKTSEPSWLTKEPPLEPNEDKAPPAASSSKAKSNLLSTSTAKTTSKSKKDKDVVSPIAEEKKSKDSIPGSFPGGFGDDDDYPAYNDIPASPEKPPTTKKSKSADTKKVDKKPAKTKAKELSAMDDMDLLVDTTEPPQAPTPPPEKKPAKKERARVERSGTGNSWGFWVATPAPKKATATTKSKDDDDVSPPPSAEKEKKSAKAKNPPVALNRSKSTKTPKEKLQEDRRELEKSSKSSVSDEKDLKTSKTTVDRPKTTSRGMSFSNFMMGGPPPSAMKTKPVARRSSTAGSRSSSRRQSLSGDGLMSPPPDDDDQPEVTGKAAKLMGLSGSAKVRSVKGKGKAFVPDPYPIDDDDMVMINDPGDSPIARGMGSSSKTPAKDKGKAKTAKSKREIKPSHTKNISQDDDVVMVDRDAEREAMVTSGPDDMAFVDHPPALRRSNTTGMTKKAAGIFGSFFGGAAVRKEEERPRSTYVTDGEDGGLPIRTREKSVNSGSKRRSTRDVDGEGFTTDADAEAARRAERRARRDAKEAKLREAEEADRAERDAKRKARRDRDKADIEARKEEEKERKRKEIEAEEARKEERRARRAEREKKPRDIDDEGIGMSADATARKEERRRLREKLEAEADGGGSRDEKRRSFYATEDDDRKKRRDEKPLKSKEKERSSRSKRQSTALMDEYHESRNGNRTKKTGSAENENAKASSWVNSLVDETPDPPPVEGTILDGSNEKPRAVGGSFKDRERDRDSKRQSRYSKYDDDPAEERERRSRRREKRTSTALPERDSGNVKSNSGGSGDPGRRSRREMMDYDPYAADKGFDSGGGGGGRASFVRGDSKRSSFFGKLF